MSGGIGSAHKVSRISRLARVMQLKKCGNSSYREIAEIIRTEAKEEFIDFLRKSGLSETQISLEVQLNCPLQNYNHQEAQRDILSELRALREQSIDDAKMVRDLECARLDDMLTACYQRAMGGHLDAIDRVLKISDQRTKLLGLNAPIDIRMKEIIYQQLEIQMNAFFERVNKDRGIPEHIRERIILIAAQFEQSEGEHLLGRDIEH